MTPENFIRAQLAAFAHREANHCGGVNNLLAVAHVIRNRQKQAWFGGDWMEIMQRAPAVASAPPAAPDVFPNLRDVSFRIFIGQIDDVVSGAKPDEFTEGALYYAELNRIESEWFKKNILGQPDEHPRVAAVGNVSFFR